MQQMRGGFSSDLKILRADLVNFASLIELELDFAEEDVNFADRDDFKELLTKITTLLKNLSNSFTLGNVLKNGIPIAIIGAPNVGKSTLLNALLNDDKAIVSRNSRTQRDDIIEDELVINGICYRFIDTAGLRNTKDIIENIGIKKTHQNIEKAQLVLYLIDASQFQNSNSEISNLKKKYPNKNILTIVNKSDLLSKEDLEKIKKEMSLGQAENNQNTKLLISAKDRTGVDTLIKTLTNLSQIGTLNTNQTIVSNARHFEALNKALKSITEVSNGLKNKISSDLMAIDIREALFHLGEITGEVTTDDLLGNIFANFCIGK